MNSISIACHDKMSADALSRDAATLSVLIPVYNVEDYLGHCIQSIMSQAADHKIEILLLDDCSTDNSAQICQQLYEQFPDNIRLLHHQRNSGLSAARNSLLESARGEYVWFLDSDDFLLPDCIQKLLAILTHERPDLVLFDYQKRRFIKKKSFPGSGRKLETDAEKLLAGVFKHGKMYSWNKVSRRNLWRDDLRFPPGRTFEDIATTPWLLLRAQSYYYMPESWVFYRTRAGSIMTSATRTRGFFDARKNDDMANALLGFKALLHKKFGDDAHAPAFYASHFIAKEFVKLARRFRAAKNEPRSVCGLKPAVLQTYFEKMQDASPVDFDTLSRLYLKKLWLFRFFTLRRAIRLASVNAANHR